jgi:hypothetical protein
MLHDDLRARINRAFQRGWDEVDPTVVELPPALDELRHVTATKAQKVLLAEALRNLADEIECGD